MGKIKKYIFKRKGSNPFISTWDTQGTSNITLPLYSGGTYNFTVDWGDGNKDKITSYNQSEATHNYSVDGTYEVKISGQYTHFNFDLANIKTPNRLIKISQIGDGLTINSCHRAFSGCVNFTTISATDFYDKVIALYSDLGNLFYNCSKLDTIYNIENWNMSHVVRMDFMFYSCSAFNLDISNWDVSNVITFGSTFDRCIIFNQPIGNWDVSNADIFSFMLAHNPSFNQPLNNWVFKATGGVDLQYIVTDCTTFNQPLNLWDMSKVDSIKGIFRGCTNFNQDIDSWDVSNVSNFQDVFRAASSFSYAIPSWDTVKATNMSWMFNGTTSFNHPLSHFKTGLVTTFKAMFQNSLFNQPINNWDTSKVTNMNNTFNGCPFNQPLNLWDTSKVTDMTSMFDGTSAFNQDISDWSFVSVTIANVMLRNSAFNTVNYDLLLNSLSLQILLPNVQLGANNTSYTIANSQAARDILTNAPNTWDITDAGGI